MTLIDDEYKPTPIFFNRKDVGTSGSKYKPATVGLGDEAHVQRSLTTSIADGEKFVLLISTSVDANIGGLAGIEDGGPGFYGRCIEEGGDVGNDLRSVCCRRCLKTSQK